MSLERDSATDTEISAQDLTKTFGLHAVFADVTCDIPRLGST
jgi:hypothetical protein